MEPVADTNTVHESRQTMAVDKPQPGNPFSCNVCKKSYTRIDHLARHYRSHSQERPFVCKVCDKTFARVDLLKRHAIKHDDPGEGLHNAPLASKRRKTLPDIQRPRAQRACQACAQAKSRCEGNRPCLRCQQKSVSCDYPPSCSKSSPEHHGLHHNGTAEIQHTQPTDNHPPLNESFAAAQTSVPPSMDRRSITDGIDPLVQISAQGSGFELPTPSTFAPDLDHSSRGAYEHDLMTNFNDVPSFDILRDTQIAMNQETSMDDFLNDEAFPKDVLDFGVDFSFTSPFIYDETIPLPFSERMPTAVDLHDAEVGVNRSGIATPGLRGKLNILASAQAFKESLWLWTPEKDDHGAHEQRNLSLPLDVATHDRGTSGPLPIHQRLNNTSRGKVLAMVLRTCEPAIYSHVVSNFPSAELLTHLVHNFINFHSRSDFFWIHLPTIEVEKERSVFLGSMIAYGAAISPEHEIRKLGFAIQEALRVSHPIEFESDNRLTRELRPIQSFALELEVGLWSGNRRKMELSESHSMPLLTMVRRAGRFRAAKLAEFPPHEGDSGEALESKWRNWVQQESFKRLALYLFYRDTRSSMSLLTQPLISYAELTTAPPCHNDLWEASTALHWKHEYLKHGQCEDATLDPRRAFLGDSTYILRHQRIFDVNASLLLATASIWPQLWQYREMMTSARNSGDPDPRHISLVISSRRQELLRMLEHIRMNAKEWRVEFKPATWLLHEQCSMHLYVSLEDVQLLAGKEGEEEARRIFPAMTAWAESSEARQALFHAGQVLRAAREHQKLMLRDASAVAVYHASLIFWAYAVTSRNDLSDSMDNFRTEPTSARNSDFVRLDDSDGPEIRRFLVLGRGIPCIQADIQTGSTIVPREVPLNEPAEIMRTTTKILQRQHEEGEKSVPPLLQNLSKLMHSLGRAILARKLR